MLTFLHPSFTKKRRKKRMRGALWPSKPFIKSIKLIIRQAHDVKNFPLQLFLSPSLIIFHICTYLPFLLGIRIIRLDSTRTSYDLGGQWTAVVKGQLISKGTKQFDHSTVRQKNEFVCLFFGRIVGLKKTLRLCLTFSMKNHNMNMLLGDLKLKTCPSSKQKSHLSKEQPNTY